LNGESRTVSAYAFRIRTHSFSNADVDATGFADAQQNAAARENRNLIYSPGSKTGISAKQARRTSRRWAAGAELFPDTEKGWGAETLRYRTS